MNRRHRGWLALMIAGALATAGAQADDIRPESRARPTTERAFADEKCIERCDIESDKCMQATNGDPDKIQACDDKYSECLADCDQ